MALLSSLQTWALQPRRCSQSGDTISVAPAAAILGHKLHPELVSNAGSVLPLLPGDPLNSFAWF